MAIKDFSLYDLVAGGPPVLTQSCDFAGFSSHWLYTLDETTNVYTGRSGTTNAFNKVVISPIGVAYPGDLVPGDGAYKVDMRFVAPVGPAADFAMNRVEAYDISEGWLVISKGDH